MKKSILTIFLAVVLVAALIMIVAPSAKAEVANLIIATEDNQEIAVSENGKTLDLQGKKNVVVKFENNVTLSVIDTTNMEMDGKTAGTLTVSGSGTIAPYAFDGNYRYLAVKTEGVYSFHPFNLTITQIGLNTKAGENDDATEVCLRVTFVANNVVRDKLVASGDYGVYKVDGDNPDKISAKGVYSFENRNLLHTYYDLSASLDNVNLSSTRHFKAYMVIDGQTIYSTYEAEVTPSKVLEKFNSNYDKFSDADKAKIAGVISNRADLAHYCLNFVPEQAAAHALNYVYNNDAKCGIDGTKTATCPADGCGFTETIVAEGTALEHELEDVAGKDATCTEDGYTAYKDCANCDYVEGKEVIIAGHNYSKGVCTACDDVAKHDRFEFSTTTITSSAGYTMTDTADGALSITGKSWVYATGDVAAIPGNTIQTVTVRFKVAGLESAIMKLFSGSKDIYMNLSGLTESTAGVLGLYKDAEGYTVVTLDFHAYTTESPTWTLEERNTLSLDKVGICCNNATGTATFDFIAFNEVFEEESYDPSFGTAKDENSTWISNFDNESVMQGVTEIGLNPWNGATSENGTATHGTLTNGHGNFTGIKLVNASAAHSAFQYKFAGDVDLANVDKIYVTVSASAWHGGSVASFVYFTSGANKINVIKGVNYYKAAAVSGTPETIADNAHMSGVNYLTYILEIDAQTLIAAGYTSIDGMIFGHNSASVTHIVDGIWYTEKEEEVSYDPSFGTAKDENSTWISNFDNESVMQGVTEIGLNPWNGATSENGTATHGTLTNGHGNFTGIKLVNASAAHSAFQYKFAGDVDLANVDKIYVTVSASAWHGGSVASFVYFTSGANKINVIKGVNYYKAAAVSGTPETIADNAHMSGVNYLTYILEIDAQTLIDAGYASIDGMIFGHNSASITHIVDGIWYTAKNN